MLDAPMANPPFELKAQTCLSAEVKQSSLSEARGTERRPACLEGSDGRVGNLWSTALPSDLAWELQWPILGQAYFNYGNYRLNYQIQGSWALDLRSVAFTAVRHSRASGVACGNKA